MRYCRCKSMGISLQVFIVVVSGICLVEAHTGEQDYDTDFGSLSYQQQLEKQKLEKQQELLIREYLLGKLLEIQEPQPPFTYKLPEPQPGGSFAVSPSDPRYYYPNVYEADDLFARNAKSKDNIPEKHLTVFNEGLASEGISETEIEDISKLGGNEEVTVEAKNEDDKTLTPFSSPETLALFQVIRTPIGDFQTTRDDMIFMAIVAGCSAAAIVIIAGIGFGWYRLHKKAKAAADVEYPAYGVTGPNKEISPTGDRKLAESAQMYHYQHQKQQIISMSNSRVSNEPRGSASEAESDEENEEGDYTVYECPGLAATGEMEVKNPLFQDDPTPAGGQAAPETLCPQSPAAHPPK